MWFGEIGVTLGKFDNDSNRYYTERGSRGNQSNPVALNDMKPHGNAKGIQNTRMQRKSLGAVCNIMLLLLLLLFPSS
jgi:hypothetical protein